MVGWEVFGDNTATEHRTDQTSTARRQRWGTTGADRAVPEAGRMASAGTILPGPQSGMDAPRSATWGELCRNDRALSARGTDARSARNAIEEAPTFLGEVPVHIG